MSEAPGAPSPSANTVAVGLNAAIVAVADLAPLILVVRQADIETPDSLPSGPFDPIAHRTMEIGLRTWVAEQTALRLGYVEQLYTFGDRGRHATPSDTAPHVISVGYLALTRLTEESEAALDRSGAVWQPWYDYFPWEDWREGRPAILAMRIEPLLRQWCDRDDTGRKASARPLGRRDRFRIAFGIDGLPWDDERVLDRFELMYEAGLVEEARRDGRSAAGEWSDLPALGRPMLQDHRRILATAISRVRAKLKYRPVVFELMPETFTLTGLQLTVEAISGRHLHKQNFRRLVEQGELVEPTGSTSLSTGGRPAALYRFRREVVQERPVAGFRLGVRL